MRRALLATVALFSVSAACIEGGDDALPAASFDQFRDQVQPLFEARCANPSCHGNERRPLEIYAPLQHRREPSQLFVDGPLTSRELEINFARTCMFLAQASEASDCELVSKPLASEAGGIDHSGVVVYERLDDPELQPLLDWIDHAIALGEDTP